MNAAQVIGQASDESGVSYGLKRFHLFLSNL
jgi:hypothetical protein